MWGMNLNLPELFTALAVGLIAWILTGRKWVAVVVVIAGLLIWFLDLSVGTSIRPSHNRRADFRHRCLSYGLSRARVTYTLKLPSLITRAVQHAHDFHTVRFGTVINDVVTVCMPPQFAQPPRSPSLAHFRLSGEQSKKSFDLIEPRGRCGEIVLRNVLHNLPKVSVGFGRANDIRHLRGALTLPGGNVAGELMQTCPIVFCHRAA
jgi:hypothetical protein